MSGCKVDLHVKVLDAEVVERAKRRGLDALVYAPHFTRLPDIQRRAQRFTDDDLLVIPAREVFTGSWRDRRHVLALALSDPIPDFITLEGAMAEFERQNALVLIPHPSFFAVSMESADIARYRQLIDGIEIYNPKHLSFHNRRAKHLAWEFDLPTFGSSYAHFGGTVGEVWTEFEIAGGRETDVLEAIRRRTPRRVGHRDGIRHRCRCWLEFAHLFWENSAPKAYRVMFGGIEETHPTHAAYEGRFDDVAVY